jgi:CelD/BcsL family acetyltransferase involved in cellulose biosynthesis
MLDIKNSIGKGLNEYDLMIGNEEYKYLWATKERRNLVLSYVHKGLLRARIFIFINRFMIKRKTVNFSLSVNRETTLIMLMTVRLLKWKRK